MQQARTALTALASVSYMYFTSRTWSSAYVSVDFWHEWPTILLHAVNVLQHAEVVYRPPWTCLRRNWLRVCLATDLLVAEPALAYCSLQLILCCEDWPLMLALMCQQTMWMHWWCVDLASSKHLKMSHPSLVAWIRPQPNSHAAAKTTNHSTEIFTSRSRTMLGQEYNTGDLWKKMHRSIAGKLKLVLTYVSVSTALLICYLWWYSSRIVLCSVFCFDHVNNKLHRTRWLSWQFTRRSTSSTSWSHFFLSSSCPALFLTFSICKLTILYIFIQKQH